MNDEQQAVPWQALLNIYECITLPAVALDGDVNTLAAFLNQYAPWAAASDCVESEVKP